MYQNAAFLLKSMDKDISLKVTEYVQTNFPDRTSDFHKCTRDLCYILDSLVYCLKDGNLNPAESIAEMFYTRGNLALKSTVVEFFAYDHMLKLIKENLVDVEDGAVDHCIAAIGIIKNRLSND